MRPRDEKRERVFDLITDKKKRRREENNSTREEEEKERRRRRIIIIIKEKKEKEKGEGEGRLDVQLSTLIHRPGNRLGQEVSSQPIPLVRGLAPVLPAWLQQVSRC